MCVEWLCNPYCSTEGNIPENTNIDRKKKKKKKIYIINLIKNVIYLK